MLAKMNYVDVRLQVGVRLEVFQKISPQSAPNRHHGMQKQDCTVGGYDRPW